MDYWREVGSTGERQREREREREIKREIERDKLEKNQRG